jgi:hypothetical protein
MSLALVFIIIDLYLIIISKMLKFWNIKIFIEYILELNCYFLDKIKIFLVQYDVFKKIIYLRDIK